MQSLQAYRQNFYSWKVVIFFVMLATNAVGSFSALRLGKTYQQQETLYRLNHIMILNVHKNRTDALTLVDVLNDFVEEKENRKQLLGKFSANDIPRDKNKGIVGKCSDLTCTKKYALTEGPKRGWGEVELMWATCSARFMLATGFEFQKT